jgi:hypothetical protein
MPRRWRSDIRHSRTGPPETAAPPRRTPPARRPSTRAAGHATRPETVRQRLVHAVDGFSQEIGRSRAQQEQRRDRDSRTRSGSRRYGSSTRIRLGIVGVASTRARDAECARITCHPRNRLDRRSSPGSRSSLALPPPRARHGSDCQFVAPADLRHLPVFRQRSVAPSSARRSRARIGQFPDWHPRCDCA